MPEQPGARPTERMMTMTACHPKFSAGERYVVFASSCAPIPAPSGLPAGALPVPGKEA